jgi:SOS regulatory protein LexA
MEELTKKQRAILDYMKAHVAEHTYWPSIRDIQAKFRFASTNAVFGHLQALERKGVLQRIPGAARAYKIVPEVLGDTSETVIRYEGPGEDAIAFESVKFAGSIAAGFPDYTESSGVLDSMQVPISPSSRRRAPEAFALRVRGDSMIDADINDGDTVIIEPGTPKHGDIVAAHVEYLSDLVSAARNLQIVQFEYENIYKGKTASYELHPYLLKEYRNKWYLIGWSENRKDYLTFGLDRILKLDLQRQTYSRRKDFNADIFFKYSIGITEFDRKPQEIVLSFDPVIGKLIKAQALHHTQTILGDTSKELKISLKLLVTEELIQTLLAYGSKVSVQKPASLKSEVKARLEKALENY